MTTIGLQRAVDNLELATVWKPWGVRAYEVHTNDRSWTVSDVCGHLRVVAILKWFSVMSHLIVVWCHPGVVWVIGVV